MTQSPLSDMDHSNIILGGFLYIHKVPLIITWHKNHMDQDLLKCSNNHVNIGIIKVILKHTLERVIQLSWGVLMWGCQICYYNFQEILWGAKWEFKIWLKFADPSFPDFGYITFFLHFLLHSYSGGNIYSLPEQIWGGFGWNGFCHYATEAQGWYYTSIQVKL